MCVWVFEQQSPGVEEGNNKASAKFSSPSSLTLTSSLSSLFPSSPPSFSCPISCLLPSCSLFLPFSLSFLRSCYETHAGLQLTVPSLQSPECWDDNLNFCSWLSSSCCPVLRTAMGTLVLEGRQGGWLDQDVRRLDLWTRLWYRHLPSLLKKPMWQPLRRFWEQ